MRRCSLLLFGASHLPAYTGAEYPGAEPPDPRGAFGAVFGVVGGRAPFGFQGGRGLVASCGLAWVAIFSRFARLARPCLGGHPSALRAPRAALPARQSFAPRSAHGLVCAEIFPRFTHPRGNLSPPPRSPRAALPARQPFRASRTPRRLACGGAFSALHLPARPCLRGVLLPFSRLRTRSAVRFRPAVRASCASRSGLSQICGAWSVGPSRRERALSLRSLCAA